MATNAQVSQILGGLQTPSGQAIPMTPMPPMTPTPPGGSTFPAPTPEPVHVWGNVYRLGDMWLTLVVDEYSGETTFRPSTTGEVQAAEKSLDGGAATGPTRGAAYYALEEQALAQDISQKAEAFPLEMQKAQSDIGYQEGMLDVNQGQLEQNKYMDQFTIATEKFNASRLAEDLAREKKEGAVRTLSSIVDNLLPPGLEHMPGFEPGGMASQIWGQETVQPTQPVAQVDFGQFTGGLNPETDAALQFLMSQGGQAPQAPPPQAQGLNPSSGWTVSPTGQFTLGG